MCFMLQIHIKNASIRGNMLTISTIIATYSIMKDIPLHQEKLVCEHVKVTNNFTVRRWFKLFGTSANYQRWWYGFGSAMFTLFTYKAVDSMATVNGTPCASYKDRFRFFNIKIIQSF